MKKPTRFKIYRKSSASISDVLHILCFTDLTFTEPRYAHSEHSNCKKVKKIKKHRKTLGKGKRQHRSRIGPIAKVF